MSDIDKIRSEIELTRSELADTVDALQAKLDVKAMVKIRAEEAGGRAAHAAAVRYAQAKAEAPPQVRQAIERAERLAAPVVERAKQDKKQTLRIVIGTAVAIIVVRRLRRAGR